MWVGTRDKVVTNKQHEQPGRTGFVDEIWTGGPNEDFPQATVIWDDDGTDDIVPFDELEVVQG